MADRPHLRLVTSTVAPELLAGVEREMELRLRAMGLELTKFLEAATDHLEDDDLGEELLAAGAAVTKARLALARRRT